jgi:excisionase family DNA binding protein
MTLENSGGEFHGAFLTTDEVLDYLKVNPRTIYRLIKAGEIPAIRIGRQWRFRRSDLDAWIDGQRLAGSRTGFPPPEARPAGNRT